jgi:hypothetical protein
MDGDEGSPVTIRMAAKAAGEGEMKNSKKVLDAISEFGGKIEKALNERGVQATLWFEGDEGEYPFNMTHNGVRFLRLSGWQTGDEVSVTARFEDLPWCYNDNTRDLDRAIFESIHRLGYPAGSIRVGDYAMIRCWTDVQACRVVEVNKSGRVVKIQRCKTRLLNAGDLGAEVGGFSVIFENDRDQKWEVSDNPEGAVCKATIRKGKAGTTRFAVANDGRTVWFASKPHEFYDHNF